MTTESVAIIVLNWNGRDDTLACLASLQQITYINYTIIVVDNGSDDGSIDCFRSQYPETILLETGSNLGYVGGNNVGIAYALSHDFDYVLLLNNDTEVAPDFLDTLVGVAQDDATIGIVGPNICYFAQQALIWSAGGKIDWQQGQTWMIGCNEPDQGQFGQAPYPVDFVTGCALLIKTAVIKQIGELDARFFAYYEETEWCVRATRAGFKIMQVPNAKIWHKISAEAREASPQVHYYMTRNQLLFLRLAHAGLRPWIASFVRYGRRLLSWTIRPKWRHKTRQRNATWQALLDYGRGRFGKIEVR